MRWKRGRGDDIDQGVLDHQHAQTSQLRKSCEMNSSTCRADFMYYAFPNGKDEQERLCTRITDRSRTRTDPRPTPALPPGNCGRLARVNCHRKSTVPKVRPRPASGHQTTMSLYAHHAVYQAMRYIARAAACNGCRPQVACHTKCEDTSRSCKAMNVLILTISPRYLAAAMYICERPSPLVACTCIVPANCDR